MKSNVRELIKEIDANRSQVSSSERDEELVMRALLNDRAYNVDVYSKEGKVDQFCPATVARGMVSNVIQGTVKVSGEEAAKLADSYEFKKADSVAFITISKEFTNSFLETGRKLPLGGREFSDVALSQKDVPQSVRTYPKKVGVNSDGSGRYEKAEANVAAHKSIRVHASCPEWIK